MADLINTFSWSYSAATEFEECRRKRYWRRYASWNGWRAEAPDISRRAWRLGKMQNRHVLRGHAVEEAVRWVLSEQRAGRPVSAESAYEMVARPRLNTAWKQSRRGEWKTDPARSTCLHEHYYPALHDSDEKAWVEEMRAGILRCIQHFIDQVLPRIGAVQPDAELNIGDPRKEFFMLEDVTVYAVPDYAYREGDLLHIHDWKSGAPRPEHRLQMGVYGWWAHKKYGAAADQIRVFIEYLDVGEVVMEEMTQDWMAETLSDIGMSVADMTDYLEDADRSRNRPLPREEWDITTDRDLCRRCCFYDLCRPELEELP